MGDRGRRAGGELGFVLLPQLGFLAAAWLAPVALIGGVGGSAWLQLERARGTHSDAVVGGARNVLWVLAIFALAAAPAFGLYARRYREQDNYRA